uniref:Uncharacterized protein n=1 Tax=Oryza glumipatula TaxID=40148 RepID=A0A0E0A0Q2_9ORYZ
MAEHTHIIRPDFTEELALGGVKQPKDSEVQNDTVAMGPMTAKRKTVDGMGSSPVLGRHHRHAPCPNGCPTAPATKASRPSIAP